MIYRTNNIFSDLDRIFDSFFYNFPKELKPPATYEVKQTEDKTPSFILQVAVAGFEEEDLKIWNEGRTLYIEGDNTNRKEVLSRFQNKFSWKIPTSTDIDLDNVEVIFKNGLLTLNIPTKVPVRNKRFLLGKEK